MPVKYVFVTGGVVSGLGKGITAASLGRLLKARGYKVTMQKFDPYINIDPGTMNPIQHGEVFVTDDGAETDLDLGHYERFIDESLTKNSNVTTGKVSPILIAHLPKHRIDQYRNRQQKKIAEYQFPMERGKWQLLRKKDFQQQKEQKHCDSHSQKKPTKTRLSRIVITVFTHGSIF